MSSLCFVCDEDGLLRTGLRGFTNPVLLVGRHQFADRRGTAVDVAELERIRSDHRAQGVSLAAFWINPDLHGVSYGSVQVSCGSRIPRRLPHSLLRVSTAVDAQYLAGDVAGF